jgi:putative PIN family toxin of toxin-antitoxin system
VRVVLDTNTIVSAIGWEGVPRAILLAVRDGRHQLVTSPDLLDELTRVLRYPRLRPVARHPFLPIVLEWIHQPEHLTVPTERIRAIANDPVDNIVLEAAVSGNAAAIVSGDRDVLALKRFRSIQILTAQAFAIAHL